MRYYSGIMSGCLAAAQAGMAADRDAWRQPLAKKRMCSTRPATIASIASADSNINCVRRQAVLQTLELPPLKCVFPVKCNPCYEIVEEECEEWTLSLFDPPLPQDERHMHRRVFMSLFSALFTPSAPSPRRLLVLTKLFNWMPFFDDVLDNADATTSAAIMRAALAVLDGDQVEMDKVIRVLKDGCHEGSRRAARAVQLFRQDAWEEICRDTSTEYASRLAADVRLSMLSVTGEERRYRKGDHSALTSINEFLDLRVRSAFVPMMLRALEYSLQMEDRFARPPLATMPGLRPPSLPQDLRPGLHAAAATAECALAQLELTCARHLITVNDYFSFRKEFFKKDSQSLTAFLLRQQGLDAVIHQSTNGAHISTSLQEVIYKIWGIVQDQENLAVRLVNEIKRFYDSLSPPSVPVSTNGRVPSRATNINSYSQDMLRYAQELCLAMAGNAYWSTITARYQGLHPIPYDKPVRVSVSVNAPRFTL